MSTEANKAICRRFYEEVINQKNLEAIDELASDDFFSHDFPPGLPAGSAGLKIFASVLHTAFPDGHLTIDQLIAEGDIVATRITFHGTHTGDFQGIAPTGKEVTVPGMEMVRIVNGRGIEHWGGLNQISLMQQLGVIPS